MRYAKGVLCVSFTQTAVYLFLFFFFISFARPIYVRDIPKSVNLLLWAQNGPIGKTSHRKIKKIDHKTDMIEGVKAPGACKPSIFCKFVFSLGYLPFARVEANQILQAESWGREILKTEQEIRISET